MDNESDAINVLRGHVAALQVLFQTLVDTHPDRESLLTKLRGLAEIAPLSFEQALPERPVMTQTFREVLQTMLTSTESISASAARQAVQSQSDASRIVQALQDQSKRPPA